MRLITCQKVITSNRVSLPEDLRKKLQVKEGDFINFIEDDSGKVIVRKVEA